jgi:hypothetical protein
MTNLLISKDLLSSVQKLSHAVKGQVLSDQLINELILDSQPLVSFFEITHFQSIVLAVYLEAKLKDRDIDLEKMVDLFGKKLSMLAEVNITLEELAEKKLVINKRLDYTSRRKEEHNKIVCVADNVLVALMKGDKSKLIIQKVEDFYSLLSQIRELIVKRIELIITTENLCDEMMVLFELNKSFPEVQWLLSFSCLSKYDLAILINIAIEHIEGQEEVNIDKMIKETYSEIRDRIRYSRGIKEKKCPLFENDLIVNSDEEFSFMNNVRLSDHSMEVLLGGYNDITAKAVKPKFGTLIPPDKIDEEVLFYNDTEQMQIDTLINALQKDNYNRIVTTLKTKGAVPNFSVLFKGPAGTGKTASCYQIAKRTNRHLYFIDLEKISSKWVGESSKNVVALFNEIKDINKFLGEDCIALFNESDSVISRRLNVNSSVDAEKNSVINNFLQEFENYNGIVFLTTNLSDNFDKAFSRRLLYKLEVKAPSNDVRKKILTKVFDEISTSTLDKINNQFQLTGGLISNISKKLLVKTLLDESINKDEYILELCEEEFILNKSERNPIGFIQ